MTCRSRSAIPCAATLPTHVEVPDRARPAQPWGALFRDRNLLLITYAYSAPRLNTHRDVNYRVGLFVRVPEGLTDSIC